MYEILGKRVETGGLVAREEVLIFNFNFAFFGDDIKGGTD